MTRGIISNIEKQIEYKNLTEKQKINLIKDVFNLTHGKGKRKKKKKVKVKKK